MNDSVKTKKELIKELQELKQTHDALRALYEENTRENRKAREEGAKLKDIMAQAEELAQLGSWEWDIANDSWILSDNWRRIHGVGDTKLTTEELLPIAHPDDRAAISEAFEEAVKSGKPYHIEHRIIRKDTGEIKQVSAKGVTIPDAAGKPAYMVGTVQDITDQKQTQEALKLSESKLRDLNAQKDKFFSIIAHDLRSPFSAVSGLSNLLKSEIADGNYEAAGMYAGLIEQSSDQAMNLLKNLLEWSRAHTGRMKFNPEKTSLRKLIKENIKIYSVAANQKRIVLSHDINDDIIIYADKPMISTVLRNLITNAIKFTGEGGEIIISATGEAEEVIVGVKDNGVGIRADRLEKLFRLDNNVSTSGTNNEGGTGLGLILCKEFVEKNGGRIRTESEPGKGSVFYFSIPCYKDEKSGTTNSQIKQLSHS
ncbi:MAG: PAS domain-containing sensor histidine kinase [Candidatus Cyclonatronum sp.]|uniref:PAS domain-containing sensor histidine kinase n=1 Tax=Cyclonatronum sp. TaxID=3024185 RepID=UPI0025BA9FAD|nr:PAS domain-containing sensor histidine kinase [Cyclonatronum sp.]MCH8486844.1 PAS domain-containing sensor histidine kinase [Cyclonatronum sp.]